MAFSATTNWEVQTGGADGNSGNGGSFDPGNASMATDLAATSATGTAPVVTSATYNFAGTDAGHWLFIKTGTNWKPGWYPITSVNSNAATLNATAGAWVDFTTLQPGTTSGCHSSASPTAGTWSVDYSQATAPYSFADIVFGATTTNCTSAGHPFGPNHVGNSIAISAGTNFTVQRVQINSVSGTTATVDKSLGTNPGSLGAGKLGGPLATPGQAGGLHIASNRLWVKAATYACASGSNAAGGRLTLTSGSASAPTYAEGYSSVRGDKGTRPILQATANSVVPVTVTSNCVVDNLELSRSASQTSVTGLSVNTSATEAVVLRCKASGGIATGFLCNSSTRSVFRACTVSAVVTGFAPNGTTALDGCTAISCTGTSFFLNVGTTTAMRCIAIGSTNDGFFTATNGQTLRDCVAYNNAGNGFNITAATSMVNCLASANSLWGFTVSVSLCTLTNCAAFNSGGSGTLTASSAVVNEGFITLSADPFTNAAGNDFSLNGAASGGALLKSAGYPSSFSGLSTTSYPDVGAVQHADPVSVDPGIANVKSGTNYTIAGSALTGTLVVPAPCGVGFRGGFTNG